MINKSLQNPKMSLKILFKKSRPGTRPAVVFGWLGGGDKRHREIKKLDMGFLSHPTHPKDAACGSQNSMRRALNAATMHVSAAAKTWQPTAANAHSYKTVNPLKSMVCQGQPTAATP